MIIALTADQLSHRQTCWHTDVRTYRQARATTIPGGQNWPRVKMQIIMVNQIPWNTVLWIFEFESPVILYTHVYVHDNTVYYFSYPTRWYASAQTSSIPFFSSTLNFLVQARAVAVLLFLLNENPPISLPPHRIISSGNGLSPVRRQANPLTNDNHIVSWNLGNQISMTLWSKYKHFLSN